MDALIKYGLMAIAIAGLVGGAALWWNGHIKTPYVNEGIQQQFDIDKPMLTKCHDVGHESPTDCASFIAATIADSAQYKQATADLQKNNDGLAHDLTACSKSIDDYNKAADANVAYANQAAIAERAKAKAATARADQLAAIAAGPVQPAGTCDEQLRKITDLLDDALANGL